MSGKPALDDYFDALLGAPPESAATPAPAATEPAPKAAADSATPAPRDEASSTEPATLLDELEAVFDQAHAEAKASGVFEQAAAPAAAEPTNLLDELEAVFEHAHAEAKASGVFEQAAAPSAAEPANLLDELEAVFEQAHAEAKASGVFEQAAAPSAAEPANLLDELEAVFEQAHAEAKASGVFEQAPPPGTPGQRELDELEAAFDAAAAAAQQARLAGVTSELDASTQVPMPGPALDPPTQGLLKPQLVKRSEAVRRRLARRDRVEDEAAAAPIEKIQRWLRFQMGGQSYAVELLKVQEVQRVPDILPVRGSAPHVVGVMNLRGQIIAVIDLAACIGLGGEPLTEFSRVIVLETPVETVGLLVSEVAEVMSLPERSIENPVSSIPALPKEALIGIARHGSSMSVLIDTSVFLR